MSLKPKKQEVKKMDINFNNIIDNYYSGDIGSEFNDELTESKIEEIIEQEIKQQQQQNNDEEKK
jgi:hypothetical protein